MCLCLNYLWINLIIKWKLHVTQVEGSENAGFSCWFHWFFYRKCDCNEKWLTQLTLWSLLAADSPADRHSAAAPSGAAATSAQPAEARPAVCASYQPHHSPRYALTSVLLQEYFTFFFISRKNSQVARWGNPCRREKLKQTILSPF